MSEWWGLVWLFVLLFVNGLFVAAEFAVVSARRSQLEPLAEAGSRRARTGLWAMEHATLMLAATQLGITVCSLLILNLSEPAIHGLLSLPLLATGLDPAAVSTISFIIALVLVSALHVVLGEMVPKNLAFTLPDRALLLLASPLVAFARATGPIVRGLNAIANGVVRLFGVVPRNEALSIFTLDQVATIVGQSQAEGVLQDESGTLNAALDFTQFKAGDVAISLDEIVTLPPGATPRDLEQLVAQRGFSRYIQLDDAGEPVGYLHLKDVLDLQDAAYDEPIGARRLRKLVKVASAMEVEDALAAMRSSGTHLARVDDDSGTAVGVLFLEDIIEELVGTVDDATRRGPRPPEVKY